MKITKIESIPISIPYRENIREQIRIGNPRMIAATTTIYKVHTDEGLIGIGEGWAPPTGSIERYIGMSPFDCMHDDSAGHLIMAFYDLMGKALGESAYKLFGPVYRDKVLTTYWSHSYTPKLLAEEAILAVEKGFTVHKIKSRAFRDPVEQVKAIVDVVPKDYKIIIDANETWGTLSKTLEIARKLQKYSQIWALEEPMPKWNFEGYRFLRNKVDFQIAVHTENCPEQTLQQLNKSDKFVLETKGLGHSLWIVSSLAEVAGMNVWLEYGLHTGISTAFQMHQAAAMPNAELCVTLTYVEEDDLIVEPMEVKNGYMTVPQGPGLGVTLDEIALNRYRTDK